MAKQFKKKVLLNKTNSTKYIFIISTIAISVEGIFDVKKTFAIFVKTHFYENFFIADILEIKGIDFMDQRLMCF